LDSSSSAAEESSSSMIHIIPKHQVQDLLYSQKERVFVSFSDFVGTVELLDGKISLDEFSPSAAQLDVFTGGKYSIDLVASISRQDPTDVVIGVDIDQSVCGCTGINEKILKAMMKPIPIPLSKSSISSTSKAMIESQTMRDIHAQLNMFTNPVTCTTFIALITPPERIDDFYMDNREESSIIKLLPSSLTTKASSSSLLSKPSFRSKMIHQSKLILDQGSQTFATQLSYSRQSPLGTVMNQLRSSVTPCSGDDLPSRIVEAIIDLIPACHRLGRSQVDSCLKRITSHNKKSSNKFNQLQENAEGFTIIDLGYDNSHAPFRIGVNESVDVVRKASIEFIKCYRNRRPYGDSPGSTSAERFADINARWMSKDKFEIVNLSMHCLQLGIALLVLARCQEAKKLDTNTINVMMQTHNQKASSQSASIPLYVFMVFSFFL
jgi:hypothetical protein